MAPPIRSSAPSNTDYQAILARQLEAERQARLQREAEAAQAEKAAEAAKAAQAVTPQPPDDVGGRVGSGADWVKFTAKQDDGTAAGAVAASRGLLEGRPVDQADADAHTTIVSDAPDVNAPESSKSLMLKTMQAVDNEPFEEEALKKLSPSDREKYLDVKDVIVNDGPGGNHDAAALLSLQLSLLEGKLPGGSAIGGEQTTLDGLQTLATQPLAEGVDRFTLVSDVVQELAVPEAIAQQNFGTCAPTSLEIQLARDNPSEYVRLVSGLASPDASVTTKGGDTLKVEAGALTDPSPRSLSQRLLAPALMELGNGTNENYVDGQDANVDANGKPVGGGLTVEGVDLVLESLYGRDFTFASDLTSPESKAQAIDFIAAEVNHGRSVPVGMAWGEGDGGHELLCTGTEERDGELYFELVNPWGRVELMSSTELTQRLWDVNYDPNVKREG
ncbi:MAG: hypothetical protein IPJ65_22995 [Archangiaceae bacterium]|nr:hypothetical protein [Archangiaceae bacterium]